MSIQLPVVNAAANDTFQIWIDKVNGIINTVANSVMTANTNANGATTTGNAFIIGIVGATTLVANTLRGGNVQSSANLTISSNALFTGDIVTLGANITMNTSSVAVGANVVLSDTQLKLGNSTVNAIINSTTIVLGPNAQLTGTSLSFGNSTVNAVVNTSGVTISGISLPTTNNRDAVAVNGSLIGTGSRINFIPGGSASIAATVDVGNNQVNVIVTSSLTLSNGAGGVNTSVLYNDSTQIGGSPSFTYDKTTNNIAMGNTLTVGTTIVNSTAFQMGNSTINSVSNSSTTTIANSTVSTSYGRDGLNIGANVVANLTTIVVGTTVIDTNHLATGNVNFTGSMSGGNVTISTSTISIGNSTVNAVMNSSIITLSGTVSLSSSALTIGGNVSVNTSFFLFGNSTVSWSGNSSQVQIANSTVAAIITPGGLTVGANVAVSYQSITVGTSVINSSSVYAASYLGPGIANTLNYFANTAGKVMTSDVLNNSGAYITLTDAASIAWDMGTGINFQVTLGGNRTLANPTNVVVGRSGVLKVVEDGTGGRTLSFGANYIFDSDTAPSITTTALKENYLFYHCVTATRILITLAAKGV